MIFESKNTILTLVQIIDIVYNYNQENSHNILCIRKLYLKTIDMVLI